MSRLIAFIVTGKAGGMKVVALPDARMESNKDRFNTADWILPSLDHFDCDTVKVAANSRP